METENFDTFENKKRSPVMLTHDEGSAAWHYQCQGSNSSPPASRLITKIYYSSSLYVYVHLHNAQKHLSMLFYVNVNEKVGHVIMNF